MLKEEQLEKLLERCMASSCDLPKSLKKKVQRNLYPC